MSWNAYKAQHKAERRKDPAFHQKELQQKRESHHRKKEERALAFNALPEEMQILMKTKTRMIK